jgi:uncharacterized protein YbaR (Trm112 family)
MAQPTLSHALLQALVCPVCHGALTAGPDSNAHAWLHCQGCGRYYPVQDGIPVMLEQRATFTAPLA